MTFLTVLKKLSKSFSSVKIVDSDVSSVAVSEIGLMNQGFYWGKTFLKNLYITGVSFGESKISTVYQSTHGTSRMSNATALLATSNVFECEGLFINGEGRVQINKKIFNAPKETRVDYQLLLGLLYLCKEGFSENNLQTIREKIKNLTGLFLNQKAYINFMTFSATLCKYSSYLLISDYLSHFYYAGGASVFSKTMLSCLRSRTKIEINSSYKV